MYVCPASKLGPTHSLSRKRMCLSPRTKKGGGRHTLLQAREWGSPNSNDWRKPSRIFPAGRRWPVLYAFSISLASPTPQFPSCHLSDVNNCNQKEGNCILHAAGHGEKRRSGVKNEPASRHERMCGLMDLATSSIIASRHVLSLFKELASLCKITCRLWSQSKLKKTQSTYLVRSPFNKQQFIQLRGIWPAVVIYIIHGLFVLHYYISP